MHIRMRVNARGVADGFTCREYLAGAAYDVAEALACHFINRGYADLIPTSTDEEDDDVLS